MARMPKTAGEVRCTVRLPRGRSCSFAVPVAHVAVGRERVVEEPDGRRTLLLNLRAGLTWRARLAVFLRVVRVFPVDVEVG